MHPLLLFVALFLPGIKSSHDITQDFPNVRRNGDERATISDTDIVPIEEPHTVDATNLVKSDHYDKSQLKPYESHIIKKFEKYKNKDPLALKKYHEFLSSKDRNILEHVVTSKEEHSENRQHQTTPHYREVKQEHYKNRVKYDEEKKLRKKMHDTDKFDKYKSFKTYKGFKDEDDGKFIDKGKRFNKETTVKVKENHNVEFPFKKEHIKRKKATEEFLKKHFKYNEEKKWLERAKRHTDSSESEDEDYNGDDEEDVSDENVSLGSVEKQMIAHLLEGTIVKDDSHPFEDTIEIKFKEKNGEDHELVPVVEDEITKKMAYVSCGRDGGPGCGREHQDIGYHHDYTVHSETGGPRKQEDDSQGDHIDMEAWLKAFEDEIINTGIDIKYNLH